MWSYVPVSHAVLNFRVGECVEMGRPIHEFIIAAPKRIQFVESAGYTCLGFRGV